MAFNLAAFKTRALTAIVFAIIMLAGLFVSGLGFIILFAVIHFGCWYEFVKLVKKIRGEKYIYFLPLGLVYITIPVLMMVFLGYPNSEKIFWDKGYENAPLYSYILPCAIIFSMWINDTMAYIVGSLIGKTPFSKISPKKTWEGTIGGAILCVLVMGFVVMPLISANSAFDIIHSISRFHWFAIAAICTVFGTVGDLLESKLKRLAGVKDSGTLMPGHGGFLDRFDSLLIATPFVWLYVYLFML